MILTSQSFADGAAIPTEFAFGKHHPTNNIELADNKNPHLEVSGVPDGTKSFVVICHDTEVPSQPDHVNKAGTTVPYDLPRVDFYHWVAVDLPPNLRAIAPAEFSSGVTPRGKPGPEGPNGCRHGLNNYTQWFAGDAEMSGDYFGYDGPCPPWNDERIHVYYFTIYALAIEKCPVEGNFTGPQVIEAIKPHIIDQARLRGTYHIYPNAR